VNLLLDRDAPDDQDDLDFVLDCRVSNLPLDRDAPDDQDDLDFVLDCRVSISSRVHSSAFFRTHACKTFDSGLKRTNSALICTALTRR